ncbi:hypothetical protein Tco_0681021 [Tanacetum coccineum]|uniref:Uncharacterized protein n=1 Tax=Tanacetum coccineum TaxID=301880 RepID=A0ABQ4XN11_9ASTR
MVKKSKLDADLQGKAVDPTRYRGMIGSLMYLTSSRPDLVFAVCMCARHWDEKDFLINKLGMKSLSPETLKSLADKKKSDGGTSSQRQLIARDERWVPTIERVKISSTNIRLEPTLPQREETFQVIIDVIKNSTCYKAFTISADIPEIFEYGLPIPETMLSNAIKQSESYQMFIKYSTVQIPLKKIIGKGSQGKKPAVTQVFDESEPELAPTPKPAKKQSGSRGTRGVVIQDTTRVPHKKLVDHSKKLKGVLMLTLDEQLAADTMQTIKNSQKTIKRQPNTGGLFKGTGITPRVPDDSTFVFPTSHKGTGNKAGVPDEEDDEVHTEIRTHDDEYVHDDADEEMKDKVEEEKANDQKEDTTVPNTQHETLELPPTSSGLSVSPGFGNQFATHSSGISLTRILKDTTDAEINSLLEIHIQQDVPTLQYPSNLSVLVSVIHNHSVLSPIPEHATETPVSAALPPPPIVTTFTQSVALEQEVKALKEVDHASAIHDSVRSHRPSVVQDYLGSTLGDTLHKRHLAHKALYDALLESIYVDEDDMDKLVVDPASKRKRHYDDTDEDPSAGSNQGKKMKRQKDKSESSKKPSASKETSKGKTLPKSSKTVKSASAWETVKEATDEVAMDVEVPT